MVLLIKRKLMILIKQKNNCIICEAMDIKEEATCKIKYNDDLIPVCDNHSREINELNIPIEDE